MKGLEKYLVKKAVAAIKNHAVRELDLARERLLKSDSTETLNFLNSGITINLKTLKAHALDLAKRHINNQKRS
jgi:hypothetical protein